MLVWNIKKCLGIFDKCYVSSDSDHVLDIAKKAKAIPLKRPPKLCGDTPNMPIYQYCFSQMDLPHVVVSVQANSPTMKTGLIEVAREIMIGTGCAELMTCHKDYSFYGSIWALTANRIIHYDDPYIFTPEILLVDDSVDIHTKADFKKAEEQHEFRYKRHYY
jgi:CMP-N-acetylneuraminic acid synthetase